MRPTVKVGGGGAQKIELERMRREDHLRVKHDKLFSDWKILVGSADWNDHIAGEEGSHRYRLHNLPSSYFGPGVYELGLTQHATTQESKHGKLRRHAVVVVYLGQADNVRQRLQRYGQTGSHLEGNRSVICSAIDENLKVEKLENVKKLASQAIPEVIDTGAKLREWFFQPESSGSRETSTNGNIQGGLRLFTEVFSRGYSIAFRWAKTESKQMAEKVEAELLHVFDYPWNTALNGARRPRDILAKLDLLQLELERSLCLGRAVGIVGSRKWAYFGRKVGISVPAKKPAEPSPPPAKIPTSFFLSPARCGGGIGGGEGEGGANDRVPVCGARLEDGSACLDAPVKSRRRCPAHKGQHTKVLTRRRSRPAVQPEAQHNSYGARTGSNDSTAGAARNRNTGRDGGRETGRSSPTSGDMGRETGRSSTISSDIGSEAGRGPTTGSDRGSDMGNGRDSDRGSSTPTVVIIRAQMQGKRVEITDVSSDGVGFRGLCGARVEGGSSCMNPPVHGRRRCAAHKGMRMSNSKHNPKGFAEEDAEYSGLSSQVRHTSYSAFRTPQKGSALR